MVAVVDQRIRWAAGQSVSQGMVNANGNCLEAYKRVIGMCSWGSKVVLLINIDMRVYSAEAAMGSPEYK